MTQMYTFGLQMGQELTTALMLVFTDHSAPSRSDGNLEVLRIPGHQGISRDEEADKLAK